MDLVYESNGLVFYSGVDIRARQFIAQELQIAVMGILRGLNRAWVEFQIEAPCFIPTEFVSKEYTADDVFHVTEELTLKPETTASSYAWAEKNLVQQVSPPYVIWQAGKSFRREKDKTFSNLRFKEFYQLEFQCIYTEGSKADYFTALLHDLRLCVGKLLNTPVRMLESDRLPSYSEKTWDLEAYNFATDQFKEIASISLRNDVPFDFNGKKLWNVEVAFGLDRLTYFMNHKSDKE